MTPIFLCSLPRSGSTFVQRVLATHPEIATTAEPWILLPPLFALQTDGMYTAYRHEWATIAIEDFCAELPRGADDYRAAVRAFAEQLYASATPAPTRYFLDKTPRYHLVIEEVFRTFPDARFIFLWRHPLAVIGSLIDHWGSNRWNLYEYHVDLYTGLANLIEAFENHADRAFAVRYEDLIEHPDQHWRAVFAHLDLDFDQEALTRFGQVAFASRVGDQVGSQRYAEVSTEPLVKWRSILTNPLRRAWCDRYLKWIGQRRLAVMGYDLDELRAELRAAPRDWTRCATDIYDHLFGATVAALELRMIRDKLVDRRTASLLTPHH